MFFRIGNRVRITGDTEKQGVIHLFRHFNQIRQINFFLYLIKKYSNNYRYTKNNHKKNNYSLFYGD
jgi:sensor histidine kinase regulating citrate/malate metabolism